MASIKTLPNKICSIYPNINSSFGKFSINFPHSCLFVVFSCLVCLDRNCMVNISVESLHPKTIYSHELYMNNSIMSEKYRLQIEKKKSKSLQQAVCCGCYLSRWSLLCGIKNGIKGYIYIYINNDMKWTTFTHN